MLITPPYQPQFDRLLEFITEPRFDPEIQAGRSEYFSLTGEVFEEDRSFDARMQAFLDWFVFDRPLAPWGEPPVRVFPIERGLAPDEAERFRLMGRTVHGIFTVDKVREDELRVTDVLTTARYDVELPLPLAGLEKHDLFEARLVPFEGRLQFSGAFLFHPRHVRRRVLKQVREQRRDADPQPVQALVWTLARMASRAEHYRNVPIDSIYDFARPPPIVAASRMKFDRESVEARLGRRAMLPEAGEPSTR